MFLTLRRSDTKRRPAERFSILIVPRNRSNVKRLECSRHLVRAAIGFAVLGIAVIVAGAASLVYYRHAYLATEDVRIQAAEFARERASLIGQMEELEASIGRTDRFAAKISSAIDKKHGELAGKGPVDESDSLPSQPAEITSQSSTSLGSGTWKSPFAKSLTAGLNLKVGQLKGRSDALEGKVHSVFALNQDKLYFWASLPSIQPTRGFLTSEFGAHRGWGGRGRLHEGIDIAGPTGTPIIAPGDGRVTFSGYYHGYGQMITIDHGYGISTLFGHCSTMFVQEGQFVKRGDVIARVGNTGSSTGPHLHYEVHVDGVPVNPELYIMQ